MTKKPISRSVEQVTLLDRIANWLDGLPRLVRALLSAIVSTFITGAIAVLLFGALLRLSAEQIGSNTLSIVTFGLLGIGILFYWIGWRVLIGFDMSETPFEVGRAGAWWVIFGFVSFIAVVILGLIWTAEALGPI